MSALAAVRSIRVEIEMAFGYFPPFFEPALGNPVILENLWCQTRLSYLSTPISSVFKEKLGFVIARFLYVPYCLLCHCSSLKPLGVKGHTIRALLEVPISTLDQDSEALGLLIGPLSVWPEADSSAEGKLMEAAIVIYFGRDNGRTAAVLKELLSDELFNSLCLLLSYFHMSMQWAKTHPEISYLKDERYILHFEGILAEEPTLLSFLEGFLSSAEGRSDIPMSLYELEADRRRLSEERNEALKMLEQEKAWLAQIIEEAPVWISMISVPDRQYIIANHDFRRMAGTDDIIGKTTEEVFPKLAKMPNWEEFNRIFDDGVTRHIPEQVMIANDGKTFYRRIVRKAKRNAKGEIEGVLTFAMDITEQVYAKKIVEEQKFWLEATFDSLPFGLLFLEQNTHKILFVNEVAFGQVGQKYGIEKGQVLNFNVLDVADSTGKKIEQEAFPSSRAARGETVRNEVLRWKASAGELFLSVNAYLLPSLFGQPPTIVLTYTDITPLIVAETASKKAQAELQIAMQNAKRANEAKSSFLANMSHEIRTPLTAIMGYTELLNEEGLGSEERSEFTDVINRNGKALLRIIEDILDLSKIEAGKLLIDINNFSVCGMISDVVSVFSDKARTKGLDLITVFTGDKSERFLSDPVRLRQILVNLVGNAVKFTECGYVKITAQVDPKGSSRATLFFTIEDSGIGLRPCEIERLFQPFVQADNSNSRRYGGTGLGLALSQRLALALGGNIFLAHSTPNKGSTFVLSVDVGYATDPVSVPHPSNTSLLSPKVLEGLKILLIEDAPENTFLVSNILRSYDAYVETAANGLEGVKKAEAAPFDVVLMDIQMPVMDGYEAYQILRSNGFRAPIIALTAHAMVEDKRRTQNMGFDAHITKPIDRLLLIDCIVKCAGGYRQ